MASDAVTFLDGRIIIDPKICNDLPTIRGKRIAPQTVLEFLGAGETAEEILSQYPSLEPADIRACLQFAALLMDIEMLPRFNRSFAITTFAAA